MQSLKQSQLTDFFKCKRNVVDDVTKNSKSATVKASQRVSNSKRLIPVNLPLTNKYRQLLEKFRHCDAIVGRLYNRKERCSIQRLTSAVESITKL
ncbi:hypothetical protein GJ496_001548 [Pomphorhynchus laevis]|nr:hypothetical protein GJ496_001548 [Pomphorhynchus laevis]